MKVAQVMKENVKVCKPQDSLGTAAQLMWDFDCGCVPVINDSSQVVGMITDRDICMAAYTKGGALRDLAVESAMAHNVITCRPEDTLSAAETLMRQKQIRRLPVINAFGNLVGILSLNDIALEAERERRSGRNAEVTESEIGATLESICHHRSGEVQLAS